MSSFGSVLSLRQGLDLTDPDISCLVPESTEEIDLRKGEEMTAASVTSVGILDPGQRSALYVLGAHRLLPATL